MNDASVDEDATLRKAYKASNFEPVVVCLVARIVRSTNVSRAFSREDRRFIWPLRRIPSRADSEYPLI